MWGVWGCGVVRGRTWCDELRGFAAVGLTCCGCFVVSRSPHSAVEKVEKRRGAQASPGALDTPVRVGGLGIRGTTTHALQHDHHITLILLRDIS